MVPEKKKTEYQNCFMAYTPEILYRMTPEEQLTLDLRYYLDGTTSGTVNIPYFSAAGNMCRGGRKSGLYRNFDVTQPVASIQKKIYPERDTYISVNTYGKNAEMNNADSIEQIRGIYIDLDVLHDAAKRIEKLEEEGKPEEAAALRRKLEKREEYLDLLYGTLQELCYRSKILPVPSKLQCSGRGYALFYRYSEVLYADDATKALHKALYLAIFERFEEVLYNMPELKEMDLEVDRHVYNIDRVARLAGTMNTKAGKYCRILSFDRWYTIEELAEAFCLNLDTLRETAKKTVKQTVGKKEKAPAAVGMGKSKREESNHINEYVPGENLIPFVGKIDRDTAKFNLQCLDKLFAKTLWVEGSHRERFIFVYYNVAKILFGAGEAYRRVLALNDAMAEPLQLSEVNYAVLHTDEHQEKVGFHGDGIFTFKPVTIISADWLDISAEVAEECGFFAAAHRKAAYAANNAAAAERDKYIAELYLKEGMGLDKIREALPEHLKCAKNTVKRALIRLGIYGDKAGEASFAGLNFEKKRRYGRKTDRANSHKTTSSLSPSSSLCGTVEDKEAVKGQILEALNLGENVFISGKAGSGKTHIVKDFYNSLSDESKNRTVFVAMNGKAAIALPKGRTLHSYFGFDRNVYIPSDFYMLPILRNLASVDRIIVDEIGQVRVDTFTHFVRMIKRAEEYYNKRIQLVFLGDFGQIKPVATKHDKEILMQHYTGLYAFDSEEWQTLNLWEFKLQKSERQHDTEFERNLDAVRFGVKSAVHYFNEKLDRVASDSAMFVCPTNDLVNRYNAEKTALFTDKVRFAGIVSGVIDAAALETKVPDIELAVGMRVMSVVNTGNYKNGMVGTVQKINKESVTVLFEGMTAPVRVGKYRFEYEGGTFTQLPLVYAYAITADKCQGMTLEEINIVPGYFAAGQLYTVLSRCKSLEGMHLLGELQEREVIVDAAALNHCA